MRYVPVSSLQNSHLKQVRLLQRQRRQRYKQGLYIAEGPHLLAEAVRFEVELSFLVISASFQMGKEGKALLDQVGRWPIPCYTLPDKLFRSLSEVKTPQGVLTILALPPSPPPPPVDERPLLLLDALQDPGNLGTILRTALAADVPEVVLSPGSTDPFGPKAVRAGMGAQLRLPLFLAPDWDAVATRLAGRTLWLTEARHGLPYRQVRWQEHTAIVISNEGQGPSAAARRLGHHVTHIPLANGVESLNAAVAASLLVYEAARQRLAI